MFYYQSSWTDATLTFFTPVLHQTTSGQWEQLGIKAVVYYDAP